MLLLLAAVVSNPPQTATATPAAAPVAAPSPDDRRVCWHEQVTGSMMPPKRICMTIAERRAWFAPMQGNVNAFRDRPQAAGGMDGLAHK